MITINHTFHRSLAILVMVSAVLIGCDSKSDTTVSVTEKKADERKPEPTTSSQNERKPITVTKVIFITDQSNKKTDANDTSAHFLAQELKATFPNIETRVITDGWPTDGTIFNDIKTVVIYGDNEKKSLINEHVEAFDELLQKGIGIVLLHHALTAAPKSPASEKILTATGGYYEIDWSVDPNWVASFDHLTNSHPILSGVKPFSINDQWLFNLRFKENMQSITPVLSTIPPTETMKKSSETHSGIEAARKIVKDKISQPLAWAYIRPTGGRSFGFTGGHNHKNWENENFSKIILNAIAWTVGIDDNTIYNISSNQDQAKRSQSAPEPKPEESKADKS